MRYSTIAFLLVLGIDTGTSQGAEVFTVNCDLAIVGQIEASDDVSFRRHLTTRLEAGCTSPKIHVYSPGGNLAAAIKIGTQIYDLHLTTLSPGLYRRAAGDQPDMRPRDGPRMCELLPGHTERAKDAIRVVQEHAVAVQEALKRKTAMPKHPPIYGDFDVGDSRCVCASACFFIWAAGSERKGDVIQIHRPYFDPHEFKRLDASAAREAYRMLANDGRAFLVAMGIPNSLTERMFSIDSQNASYLSAEELKRLSMAPHWAEMKTARCGPEPKREIMSQEQARAEEEAEMVQGRAPSPRYADLPWPTRKHLVALANREACWWEAQKALRKDAIDTYLKNRGR